MTPPEPSAKRRWWPRYSLRTFLVAMLLVGVVLGCIGVYWHRLRQQRAIVAKIEAADGQVVYDWQFGAGKDLEFDLRVDALTTLHTQTEDGRNKRIVTTSAGSIVEVETPPGPRIIRKFLGDDAFAHVEVVAFSDWDFQTPGNFDPKLLLELPRLKRVSLFSSQVNDKWLQLIAQIPHLRVANLVGDAASSASAEGVAGLQTAQHLDVLWLIGDWLHDDTVRGVADLRQLKSLSLSSPNITSAVFANLDELTNLRELVILRANNIDDQGTDRLARLVHLQTLILSHTAISDASMVHLRGLKQLETVDVSWTNVGDAGIAHLAGARKLKRLNASGTRMGDAGLEAVSELPNLRYLSTGPLVTDAALPAIARMTQLEVLELYPSAVTDEGLVHLQSLKNLRRLHIGPNVTSAAADALRKALPECDIVPFDNAGHSL